MTAIVALRLVMALLQEVDQEDQCIGNLSWLFYYLLIFCI
jgi:hypothetical protein